MLGSCLQESLPPEYARIFAFDSWRRTAKAAEEAAAAADAGRVPSCVAAGSLVRVILRGVNREDAGEGTRGEEQERSWGKLKSCGELLNGSAGLLEVCAYWRPQHTGRFSLGGYPLRSRQSFLLSLV